jgi:TetR/AcrR family transcriptional regulator of autoinduction and epiphytic fitness
MARVNTSSVAKRTYHSPLRRAQAEATRARILDAALELFAEQGYAATSVSAIAARAGVAPETIYSSFGTKRALIDGLIERVDAEGAPARAARRAQELGGDPRAMVMALAETATDFWARHLAVVTVLRAGVGDPEIGDEWLRRQEARRGLILRMLSALPASALRTGLDVPRATDIAWGLTSDELFRLMVTMRRWSVKRYAAWLREELVRAILADPGGG